MKIQTLHVLIIVAAVVIVFHIILLHSRSKDFSVAIHQDIVLSKEGPIIHFKSPRKEKKTFEESEKPIKTRFSNQQKY